jgi:uncharacterized protein YjeT (DUF2065 family)
MCRFLRLAPGLYLVLNGGLLLASPRWFVRVHALPFYPPRVKQMIGGIGTHDRASRLVGLVATVAGVAYLLVGLNSSKWCGRR